ncbi:MAG: hypothetical protein AMJ93_08525 [Anaerolineae bacterium SM23_84]|nr:MAG: hypothetical protein AMJ93_08525 [Anaerolineae bacterium SM23_84]
MGFLCLCVCSLSANGRTAAAQTPISPTNEPGADLGIQRLRIQVMPEFDDPRVLVIIQGRLAAPDTAFPLPVTFRVPRGAQINQMAVMDVSTGATTGQPFDAQPDPDDARWSLVTYTLDNAHFFYEYYYNPLEGETDKQFTYAFSSPQPVENLLLEVQQPLAATNFTLDPSPTIARFDEGLGFTYHQFNVGSLAAGEESAIAVSYTKANPEPSLSRAEVMAMQTQDEPSEIPPAVETGHAGSPAPTWTLVLLGAVALVSVGGFVWYRSQPSSVSTAAVARVSASPQASKARSSAGFCTECGATLKTNARFCHVCGVSCKADLE